MQNLLLEDLEGVLGVTFPLYLREEVSLAHLEERMLKDLVIASFFP